MKKYSLFLSIIAFTLLINCSRSSSSNYNQKQEEGQQVEIPKNLDKRQNLKTTGDSANDILSNNSFTKLLIEIAYVEGFKPKEQAVTEFTDFLKKYTFKETISIIYKKLESPGVKKLELRKVRELEIKNRVAYNFDDTLSIYIYFADAPSDEDEPEKNLFTLGSVYRNTSMIIYESTLKGLVKDRPSLLTALEAATLSHEFGHLFGLVNLGTTPVRDHEDVESSNHCNVESCLMKAELQFGNSMKRMLVAKNGIVPDLDPECLADLKANGGR